MWKDKSQFIKRKFINYDSYSLEIIVGEKEVITCVHLFYFLIYWF